MLYQGTNLAFSNNLKGAFLLFNEEIENHNQKVISKAMEDETVDYDDEIITKLKEHQINCSYWTHDNAKGNILAFIENECLLVVQR